MNRLFFYGILLFATSCNIDFKPSAQASKSIVQSKEKKVFISQYQIDSVHTENVEGYSFKIKEAWAEKSWCTALDSLGNKTYRINENASPQIVFTMDSAFQLTEGNYLKEWIIWDKEEHPTGIMSRKINMSVIKNEAPETLELKIYKLNKPNSVDIKNTIRIGTVWLHKMNIQ